MSVARKKIISALSFLLFYFIFSYFFIFPSLCEIKKLSEEISRIKADFSVLEERRENIQNFRKKFSQIKENLFLLENSFVEKDFPIDFIKFLEETAKSENILLEINPPTYQKDGFLAFLLKIEGESSHFFRFLEKIESCQYLVMIEKVNFFRKTPPQPEKTEEKSVVELKGEVVLKVCAK